jgi:transposase
VDQELELLELLQDHNQRLEARILERVRVTPTLQRIMSIPGPAEILSIVIERELGSIGRFPSPKHFASYAGVVPRVQASGGKVHHGRMIKQANHYLKWAFIEAANVVARERRQAAADSDHTALDRCSAFIDVRPLGAQLLASTGEFRRASIGGDADDAPS